MGDDVDHISKSLRSGLKDECNLYRGNLKLALLRCLREGEMHGLDMIRMIEEITRGEWVPSPGSVYPALREFELHGYVTKRKRGRSIIYSMTAKGSDVFDSLSHDVKQQLEFMEWIMKS